MLPFSTRRTSSAPLDRAPDPRAALAPPASDHVNEAILTANTAKRLAVPAGAAFVVFSASADFRAKFGTNTVTAAIASADVVDGSASELNPAARSIPIGVTHIGLIAPATATVTLSFYGA